MKTFGRRASCVLGCIFLSTIFSIAARAADTNPPPRLTVELRDGSRVVGDSVAKNIEFQSALLGKVKLAVKDIRSVECVSSNSAKLSTVNGDSLTVAFVDSSFAVKTSFGKVDLQVSSVRKFSVSASGTSAHPAGLVALWSGEGDGLDSIGGNNLALMDVSFEEGKVGQAFEFNGQNQWANCGNSSLGNFGENDFTVMFWVKFNELRNEQIMVEKFIEPLNGSPLGWTITKLSNNRFRFAEAGGGAPLVDYGAAVASTWLHMTVTRNHGMVACYVHGVLSGQLATLANLDSTATLKFGHRGNTVDTPGSADTREMYLNGALDEIAIYNRALSAEEIKSIGITENNGEPLPPPASSPMPFNRIYYRNGSANGFGE